MKCVTVKHSCTWISISIAASHFRLLYLLPISDLFLSCLRFETSLGIDCFTVLIKSAFLFRQTFKTQEPHLLIKFVIVVLRYVIHNFSLMFSLYASPEFLYLATGSFVPVYAIEAYKEVKITPNITNFNLGSCKWPEYCNNTFTPDERLPITYLKMWEGFQVSYSTYFSVLQTLFLK